MLCQSPIDLPTTGTSVTLGYVQIAGCLERLSDPAEDVLPSSDCHPVRSFLPCRHTGNLEPWAVTLWADSP